MSPSRSIATWTTRSPASAVTGRISSAILTFPETAAGGAQVAEWLNPAAFGENALGTFGDTGRNRFTGPGYAGTDLALQKNFRIVERFAVQFRFEAFNAFNRPNLWNPNNWPGRELHGH